MNNSKQKSSPFLIIAMIVIVVLAAIQLKRVFFVNYNDTFKQAVINAKKIASKNNHEACIIQSLNYFKTAKRTIRATLFNKKFLRTCFDHITVKKLKKKKVCSAVDKKWPAIICSRYGYNKDRICISIMEEMLIYCGVKQ